MRRPLLVRVMALATVATLAPPAAAQSMLPIAVDQRVRLWTAAAEAITGRVVSITADAMQVMDDGGDAVTVVTRNVRQADVSRERTSRSAGFRKGAIWGAIILASIGAVSAGLQHETIGDDGASVGEAVALGVWSGGLFGALIGGGIGAARAGDRWEQVFP
jgi:hypothetical protein